jgi:hypothetical protein
MQFSKFGTRLAKIEDLFSITQLLKTLFAPFHQYSANETGHGPTEALKAWFNRSFSRMFGFVIRTFTIIVGVIALLGTCFIQFAWLIAWPVLPFIPIIYVTLIVMGVV